jgi:hypothetical protein
MVKLDPLAIALLLWVVLMLGCIYFIKRQVHIVKRKRVNFKLANWYEADRLIRDEGWSIAEEENSNKLKGHVYVEKLEDIDG